MSGMSDRTPAETIRAAAKLMRERARAMAAEMETNPYWASDPEQSPAPAEGERYRDGVKGGLGGASGEMASAWDIDANLAAAEWLDASAQMWDEGTEWTEGLILARAYLGEVTP
jgi:hypothetical protein